MELLGVKSFDNDNMSEENQTSLIQECKELLQLLDIILVEEIETEEKLTLIEQQLGIEMRNNMKGKVNNMSTIGEAMALKAIRKGLDQGRLEGRLEGRQEGRQEGRREGRREGRQEGLLEGITQGRNNTIREMIENMRKNGVSLENIVLYTGIPLSELSCYISDMKK